MEPTQAAPGGHEPENEGPVPDRVTPELPAGGEPGDEGAPPPPVEQAPGGGLVAWLAVIGGGSTVCALLGHPEMALFFAGAGLFALAQAADAVTAAGGTRAWLLDAPREAGLGAALFALLVRAIVPGVGALAYLGIGTYAVGLGNDPVHQLSGAWSFVAAAVSLALVSRRAADGVASWLFRGGPSTRTRRLTARLVVLGLMLPVPMQAMMPELLDTMRESTTPLADARGLVAQLLGEIAVALAGVGWLVSRRGRATMERLGLGSVRPAHAGWIALGLVGAIGINAGMEAVQRNFLFDLWRQDQEVTRIIAGNMTVATALVLGISAGFGEEIAMRGALQPRLGIVLTALLFACGHVQYSWFGMLTITLLGILLGVVRARTNTSAAIVVHVLYDVFAVLGSQA